MSVNYSKNSTVQEIRERFDNDVDRFSDLNVGQLSTMDAVICLDLITEAAKVVNPLSKTVLDIGSGAGNYTLKMLTKLPGLDCTLVDLSMPMLTRAKSRVSKETTGQVEIIQGDIRDLELSSGTYDIILAGAVLHHLRDDAEWEFVFKKIFNSLKEGGSFWISDLIIQNTSSINSFIWEQYGDYLEKLGGADYKQKVLDYIKKEDTPRSLNYQLDLLKRTGFRNVEILHKNLCFAAFGGVK